MKKSDQTLLQFGTLLSEVSAHEKITVREICQEAGISSATFSAV